MLFLFVLISVPLAYGVAPGVSITENPLVLMMCAVLTLSSILALFSTIFQWDWQAKYYGIFSLSVAGISFMAIVPCLGVLLYGKAPLWVRICIISFYAISHVNWCRKFAIVYREIFLDESLRSMLFEEDLDAIYYMRKGDNFLLEKHFKFSQLPRDRDFLVFLVLAFLTIPIMDKASAFIGVPFVHVFLIIAMLPVSWMSIGLAFRAYLIFYYYPMRMKKATGKNVYVDLESKHRSLREQRA
jgi:hypothetical protein